MVLNSDALVKRIRYDTSNPSRGKAIVVNYTKDREGSVKDAKDVSATLERLDFEVKQFTDLRKDDLDASLKQVAEMDHTESDCLAIVVMAHGNNDTISTVDDEYDIKNFWLKFVGNKCPSLKGKPKMVFIQSCRGTSKDTGVVETDASPVADTPVRILIPMYADLLVMYAAYENHEAYRNPEKGSWFIQELCSVLNEDIAGKDLLSLLTMVSYRVAYNYGNEAKAKQIPMLTSMLTKPFYFVNKKSLPKVGAEPPDTSGNEEKQS